MKFKRVYHRYDLWEEIAHGMWSSVDNRRQLLDWAVEFTGDHVIYGDHMTRVIVEWPISCENSLTNYQINRRAWIGHAACALANKCPEYIVRQAWGQLTNEQRFLANKKAEGAIQQWELRYSESKGIHGDVGATLLF